MEYQNFTQKVRQLGYIQDDRTADAAVKTVLGLLTTYVQEPQARNLTEKLPSELSFERLRGHMSDPNNFRSVSM
ncbi:MAG: hypothetical protein SGI97_03975 [candidate division Zixibacteria bacterium]|nr:hypothetical protein [candidate division Zixibacteria bacterium]